ncbi:hypothetical protein ACH5RR_009656 [Cinchona calisaya]|uniref:Uncharacterized protein n=1 Tax=Cinchona calisaya TaxID=153742 RepID=A0ABD3AFB1_9GENT
MAEAQESPSLVFLCLNTIADQLLLGDYDDDYVQDIYQLPSELFDSLLPLLTPLALHNLHQSMPLNKCDDCGPLNDKSGTHRKRKRWMNFETAWKMLYETRWPDCDSQSHPTNWLEKRNEAKDEITDEWMQMYWERHLQSCLDAAAEIALLPSFYGSIGVIEIPAALLNYMGYRGCMSKSTCDYSKFSYHCKYFGSYARFLRLPSALCVPEICDLLRISKLESLEIQWIKSKENVDGLCGLLKQNRETLKSIELIHCKFSTSFINDICDSLWIKRLNTHGIQHFAIKTSSFDGSNYYSLPAGLATFLSSGRSLSSLSLCDDHLHQHFVKMVLNILLDTPSSIEALDLSENNITGWLSRFQWSTKGKQLSSGIGKSLQSLRVLNLRNTNLLTEDADCLKFALLNMPKLETLDLSDNPIEDEGIKSMISYFTEMSERPFALIDLKLGNCQLTCEGVSQLLGSLSTWKKPLSSLSVRENDLGSKMGALLGKYLCRGVQSLDIDDIGLGPSGFRGAQEEITGDLKLVYINISKNRGEVETAKFLSKLISCAPGLVAIDAQYTFMPEESFSIICSTLKAMKGKLEHLDLTGNLSCERFADTSVLAELQISGKCNIKINSSHAQAAPYDDDP